MSGGIWEYTMSNIINSDGKTMITSNSGFSTYPDAKYYDKYNYGVRELSRARSKLGDGIKEFYIENDYGWYGDFSRLANSSYSWFVRSGYYGDGNYAGIFFSYDANGRVYVNYSTRLIIVP